MFDHIKNWTLKAGSHDFPGPDGGTCINEAAIVAAGFEYRAVRDWTDCPACFSPPLSAAFIHLNDAMDDETRQELLLPFVTRLSGSRDTDEIEVQRARFIAVETVRRILPIALRAANMDGHAKACEAVPPMDTTAATATAHAAHAAATNPYATATATAAYATNATNIAASAHAAHASAHAAHASAQAAAYASANAANAAANAANADANAARKVWAVATAILDEALKIGKQADPLDAALIVERMERAKVLARD